MFYPKLHLLSVALFRSYFVRCLQCVIACLMVCGFSLPAQAVNHLPAQPKPSSELTKIGIIGSGWLGGTVGKLLVQAGYDVMFSSLDLDNDELLAKQLGTHAHAGTPKQAALFGPVVILAVPYGVIPLLGKELDVYLKGKIILDGTNPYEGRDGAIAAEALKNGAGVTTQKYFPDTRVVRVFNGVDASQIKVSATRQENKLAIPVAGNDEEAVQTAMQLVSAIGSEPVLVGNLATAKVFQPNGPGFRVNTTADNLRRILGLTK